MSELTVRLFCHSERREESTRSDSVLDTRHCGNPFEQRNPPFSRLKQVFALATHFCRASRRFLGLAPDEITDAFAECSCSKTFFRLFHSMSCRGSVRVRCSE